MSYRNYKVKLDTARTKNNKDMSFYFSDTQSDQFTVVVTEQGKVFDLRGFTCAMIGVSPTNKVSTQYITEVDANTLTILLERQMMNEVGQWYGRIVLFTNVKTLLLDTFTYTVQEDELTQVSELIADDDRLPLLTQLINDNMMLEEAEKQRVASEAIRITNEEHRIAAEKQRQLDEMTRQHEEVDRNQYELQRQKDETARIHAEQERQQNEQLRQGLYEYIQEEEEVRKQNEALRVAAEQLRQQHEQARHNAEIQRIGQEDVRVAAEQQRQNEHANRCDDVNNMLKELEQSNQSLNDSFDNYKAQTDELMSNTTASVNNEIAKMNNEVNVGLNKIDAGLDVAEQRVQACEDDVKSKLSNVDSQVNSKLNEVENRFNALTSTQQQSSEVIDARDGEVSLKARLDRDIEKAKQIYVDVEGTNISTDSSVGYAKDIEILGNTVQNASNLADIRSVGDKVEGQELYKIDVVSCGKNLLTNKLEDFIDETSYKKIAINLEVDKDYIMSTNCPLDNGSANLFIGGVLTNTNGCWNTVPRKVVGNGKVDVYIKKSFVSGTFEDFFNGKYYIQIEEGTKATPYEPYQEDKLTILSPVQLEKVGDVSDRIICKDGVWGVEKNIVDEILDETKPWSYAQHLDKDNSVLFVIGGFSQTILNQDESCFTDLFINKDIFEKDEEGCYISNSGNLYLRVSKEKANNLSTFKSYLTTNNIKIKYAKNNNAFIPLPNDQQVKLRTFANRTNIHFETEIEGTIKAQVPKSIGATVNTHTEQINNLNKELNRVKKLEESTVSTVTTESNFTTVEETSNGYFEDIKLEGKTLVVNDKNEEVEVGADGARLMSVGQDADEIVVSSVNENLCPVTNDVVNTQEILWYEWGGIKNAVTPNISKSKYKFYLGKGTYRILWDSLENVNLQQITTFDGAKVIASVNNESIFTVTNGTEYVLRFRNVEANKPSSITNCRIIRENTNPYYTPHQSDKKRLLYYNEETQTWEKPILRQWDSIEKHADGKYYYHKRSGEIVLNGSENWGTAGNTDTTSRFYFKINNAKQGDCICNLFKVLGKVPHDGAVEGCGLNTNSNNFYINILNSKLSTQNATGFKAWLQANNVTVVYQLAQEEVYECTNIDLITYEGETNYVVNSGAISPKSTLKVMSNIGNVVRELQQKVSNLENYIQHVMIDALNNALNE